MTDSPTDTTEALSLTALDRCDRCSSQAKVAADFANGRLLFCWHHARRFRAQLESQALVIHESEPDPWVSKTSP